MNDNNNNKPKIKIKIEKKKRGENLCQKKFSFVDFFSVNLITGLEFSGGSHMGVLDME